MSDQLFLYVDTETLPTMDPAVRARIAEKFPAPPPFDESKVLASRSTKPGSEAHERSLAENREKGRSDHVAAVAKAIDDMDAAIAATNKDGRYGHLATIALAGNDGVVWSAPNPALHAYTNGEIPTLEQVVQGERDILSMFWSIVRAEIANHAGNYDDEFGPEAPTVVAHYADFDIRMIWQRSRVLGIEVPGWWPIGVPEWHTDRVNDTMFMWAGRGGRIGLDELCRVLGVSGKTGVDGSMVAGMVAEGRIREVDDYCCDDVERLRRCHRRLRGLPADPTPRIIAEMSKPFTAAWLHDEAAQAAQPPRSAGSGVMTRRPAIPEPDNYRGQYRNIAQAALLISLDIGGINVGRSVEEWANDFTVWLAKQPVDIEAIDRWLGCLSDDDFETVCVGEYSEQRSAIITAPEGTDQLLNDYFAEAA